jgi:oligopeptide/dipeptide ABC transporter ATP-binding protein
VVTPTFVAPEDTEAVTELLRAQLEGLPARSPLYAEHFAEHGVTPAAFSSLDDLRKFPFTTKQMLRDSQAAAPPLGRHAGVDMSEVIRVHASTGTTGKPSWVGVTRRNAARPHELSGGQCQRVAIARAIALNPALVICDEAVSSLDVLIQAQVLNLFEQLRSELGLSYLFIAHDLALVKQVSDRVAVMHLGQLAEIGPADALYRQPLHPYPAALLDSIPGLDPATGRARRPVPLRGEPPSPLDPPSGCRFRTRCARAQQRCADEEPVLSERAPGQQVACHFPLDVAAGPEGTAGAVGGRSDPAPAAS